MIIGIVGDRGSGKTLFQTYLANCDFKGGREIYANYHLKFAYKLLNLKDLLTKIQNKEQLKNCTLLIDEIHIFFESRRSGSKKNLAGSYLATQSRKRSLDILYTTQYLGQVEKRIRDNTDYLVRSFKIDEEFFKYDIYKKVDSFTLETGDYDLIKTLYLQGENSKKIYDMYDTEEIIMDLGEMV